MIRVNAPEIYKEYQIPVVTASPSTALLLALTAPTTGKHRAVLEAVSDRIVFKFGATSDILASKAVDGTSKAMEDGCFTVASGMAIEVDLPDGETGKYVSAQGMTGNGTAIVKLCKPQG